MYKTVVGTGSMEELSKTVTVKVPMAGVHLCWRQRVSEVVKRTEVHIRLFLVVQYDILCTYQTRFLLPLPLLRPLPLPLPLLSKDISPAISFAVVACTDSLRVLRSSFSNRSNVSSRFASRIIADKRRDLLYSCTPMKVSNASLPVFGSNSSLNCFPRL